MFGIEVLYKMGKLKCGCTGNNKLVFNGQTLEASLKSHRYRQEVKRVLGQQHVT
jgi:hypothetical protein